MKPENLCLKIKNILFFQGPQYFLWRFQARIIPKNDPIDSTPRRLAQISIFKMIVGVEL